MIQQLPFDSGLFGYPVGKYVVREPWKEAEFLVQATDYRLVYLFSEVPIETTSEQITWVDTRLTFQKSLSEPLTQPEEIQPYSGRLTEVLLNLAWASGGHSRFKTDGGFKGGEFEKLYLQWISGALESQEVLVAKDFSGMVTCTISSEKAQIGLIAVKEDYRGKGLGKRLVEAAEAFAFLRGAKTLSIGTQKTNFPAVSLYQRLGFGLIEQLQVYHYWNNVIVRNSISGEISY